MPGFRATADQKQRTIAALLSGATIARAAEEGGIHERTLRRWLATDDDYAARLDAARTDQSQRVAAALTSAATIAVATLIGVMQNERNVHARVAAARAILSVGPTWERIATLDARLAEVEAALVAAAERQPLEVVR